MNAIIYIDCIYIYIYIYIQSTPDKSDSQGTWKIVRLSEMSDLSEIQNIMQLKMKCAARVKWLPKYGIMQ